GSREQHKEEPLADKINVEVVRYQFHGGLPPSPAPPELRALVPSGPALSQQSGRTPGCFQAEVLELLQQSNTYQRGARRGAPLSQCPLRLPCRTQYPPTRQYLPRPRAGRTWASTARVRPARRCRSR